MKPLNTLVIAIVIMVGTLVLVRYLSPMCENPVQESFEDPKPVTTNTFAMCPPNTTEFMDAEGVMGCCKGDATGVMCHGKVVCTISTNTKNIPLCVNYIQKNYERIGAESCPKSMPHYYRETTPKGSVQKCTDSRLLPDLSGPVEKNAKTCFFKDGDEDVKHEDSCIIQKLLETTVCPAEPCTKKALQADKNVPIIIQVSFTSPLDKMPHVCLEDRTAIIYGNFINKPIDKNSPELCSNAKQIYVNGVRTT